MNTTTKKIIGLGLTAAMTLSLGACSSDTSTKKSGGDSKPEKITVWSITADLKQFAEKYTAETGIQVDYLEVQSGDYQTKLQAALGSKSTEVDIIVGEPQMLPNFFEAGYFTDLTQYGADAVAKEKLVDYVYEVGKDTNGTLRAISWQMTPGSIIYRRDLAQEVWGNDDPDFVAAKYKDYNAMITSAQEIKDKGYVIFADQGGIRRFADSAGSWLDGNKLVMSADRLAYFDCAVSLYQNEYIAYAPEWSAAWYASMAGELPVNAGWSGLDEIAADTPKTQVMSYVMPSWGALIIRDHAEENVGKYGICSGPNSFFGGGTFMGISEYSLNKDASWDFVEWCTLNADTQKWWADVSGGDVVSMKSVLEELKDKEVEAFGGQKTYQFYLNEAQYIDYSIVTGYDDQIGAMLSSAIEKVMNNEMSKDDALKAFYKEVKETFPEIEVPQ